MIGPTWLLIGLSHGGFWFGNAPQQMTIAYRLERPMPKADLEWELNLDQTLIASGHQAIPADGHPVMVNLKAPQVRAPLELSCNFRLVSDDTHKIIESAEKPVWLFPPIPIEPIARLITHSRLIVVDADDRFTDFLKRHNIEAIRLDSLNRLPWTNADLVIVNLDERLDPVLSSGGIRDMLSKGARILLVRSDQASRVTGAKSFEHDQTTQVWRLTLPSQEYEDDPRVQMAIAAALCDVMESQAELPEKSAARRSTRTPVSPGWILTPPGEK